MSIEAMKQALEALENKRHEYRAYQAITALRQAIEQAENMKPTLFFGRAVYFADPQTGKFKQAEKQGPVANRSNCGHKEFMPLCQMCQAMGTQAHSYTAPPRKEWVGLTDEEIMDVWPRDTRLEFVRIIEAKLKEKNNG